MEQEEPENLYQYSMRWAERMGGIELEIPPRVFTAADQRRFDQNLWEFFQQSPAAGLNLPHDVAEWEDENGA